ncbi:MAG: hypothetical protein RID09_03335 [Coleofasciculus sp. G1-WW12-02]
MYYAGLSSPFTCSGLAREDVLLGKNQVTGFMVITNQPGTMNGKFQ